MLKKSKNFRTKKFQKKTWKNVRCGKYFFNSIETLKFRKFFHLVSNHKLYTTTITTVPKNLRRPALSTRLQAMGMVTMLRVASSCAVHWRGINALKCQF